MGSERGHGEIGAGMHGAGHAGTVDQHLEHGALLAIGGDDDYGELWHVRTFNFRLPISNFRF